MYLKTKNRNMNKQLNLFGEESTEPKLHISWQEFDNMANKIANFYKDEGITQVVGLSRGGLPLGVTLSNRMGVPFIPVVWQTRDGRAQDLRAVLNLQKSGKIDSTLFVDDICDSGLTIKQIRQLCPDSRWATLINKQPGFVEYSAQDVLNDAWIVFPWE